MKLTTEQIKAIEELTGYTFDNETLSFHRFVGKKDSNGVYGVLFVAPASVVYGRVDNKFDPIGVPTKWLRPLADILEDK